MKKAVLVLLVGLLLTSTEIFAAKYNSKRVVPTSRPPRMPSQYLFSLYLDENTGDLAITPNHNIADLRILITGSGVTYLDTTVSLSLGQSYTDCLNYLDVGTYYLTLIDDDEIVDQYEITVEDD